MGNSPSSADLLQPRVVRSHAAAQTPAPTLENPFERRDRTHFPDVAAALQYVEDDAPAQTDLSIHSLATLRPVEMVRKQHPPHAEHAVFDPGRIDLSSPGEQQIQAALDRWFIYRAATRRDSVTPACDWHLEGIPFVDDQSSPSSVTSDTPSQGVPIEPSATLPAGIHPSQRLHGAADPAGHSSSAGSVPGSDSGTSMSAGPSWHSTRQACSAEPDPGHPSAPPTAVPLLGPRSAVQRGVFVQAPDQAWAQGVSLQPPWSQPLATLTVTESGVAPLPPASPPPAGPPATSPRAQESLASGSPSRLGEQAMQGVEQGPQWRLPETTREAMAAQQAAQPPCPLHRQAAGPRPLVIRQSSSGSVAGSGTAQQSRPLELAGLAAPAQTQAQAQREEQLDPAMLLLAQAAELEQMSRTSTASSREADHMSEAASSMPDPAAGALPATPAWTLADQPQSTRSPLLSAPSQQDSRRGAGPGSLPLADAAPLPPAASPEVHASAAPWGSSCNLNLDAFLHSCHSLASLRTVSGDITPLPRAPRWESERRAANREGTMVEVGLLKELISHCTQSVAMATATATMAAIAGLVGSGVIPVRNGAEPAGAHPAGQPAPPQQPIWHPGDAYVGSGELSSEPQGAVQLGWSQQQQPDSNAAWMDWHEHELPSADYQSPQLLPSFHPSTALGHAQQVQPLPLSPPPRGYAAYRAPAAHRPEPRAMAASHAPQLLPHPAPAAAWLPLSTQAAAAQKGGDASALQDFLMSVGSEMWSEVSTARGDLTYEEQLQLPSQQPGAHSPTGQGRSAATQTDIVPILAPPPPREQPPSTTRVRAVGRCPALHTLLSCCMPPAHQATHHTYTPPPAF
ncbi:hypothetical protein HaLaN_06674, partial [Haematococcus lacustris]